MVITLVFPQCSGPCVDNPSRSPFFTMDCRPRCAACCIAPSISSPIPGHPNGKPAGMRCAQLDDTERCRIFGQPERPAVCGSLQPSEIMCGDSREQAMRWLGWMEEATAPEG
jgi:Fe-S-cluster containining protein